MSRKKSEGSDLLLWLFLSSVAFILLTEEGARSLVASHPGSSAIVGGTVWIVIRALPHRPRRRTR